MKKQIFFTVLFFLAALPAGAQLYSRAKYSITGPATRPNSFPIPKWEAYA